MTWSKRAGLLRVVALATVALAVGPTRATPPPGRYAIAGGTVTDVKTGLVWEQNDNLVTYTWAAARTRCQDLVLDGDGWRLPTVKELLTIVDDERWSPSLDGAFVGSGMPYWSDTPSAGNAAQAWFVSFNDGIALSTAKGDSWRVRCVR